VIKNGKKIIYGEVSITSASGRLIAHATATYLRLEYDLRE
jgi:acyl-coenzyme A thioesterase PaaI-like protein